MHEQVISFEKIDHQILHALQIWPRVPWSALGALLNIDAATASRHWLRMQESRVAWFSARSATHMLRRQGTIITSGPPTSVSAVIELRVSPRWLNAVLEHLQEIEELNTVRATLGEWNVSMDWRGRSISEMLIFVNHRLAMIDGARATRSFVVTHVPIEGSTWRYEGLTADQEGQLRKMQREDLVDPIPLAEYWHPIDDKLIELVEEDARMSYTEMARRTNSVAGTVKRHLGHLLRNRDLVIRCDIARAYSSRPITVRYFASVPATNADEILAELSNFPEIRSCSVLLGRYNLMMSVWLETLLDAARFEAKLARRLPMVTIEERDLVAKYYIHNGQTIDVEGLIALNPSPGEKKNGTDRPLDPLTPASPTPEAAVKPVSAGAITL